MKNEMTFYKRLVKLGKMSRKSLNQVEREIGLPRNALNNYKGGRDPSATRVFKVSKYFNVSMEYLLGEEEHLPNVESYFSQLSPDLKVKMSQLCQQWLIECIKSKKK